MKNYIVLTSDGGSINIGQFPDIDSARFYAVQQYGMDTVADVVEDATITIGSHVSTIDPAWYILAAAGLLILLSSGQTKTRRKKRGRNVSR